MSRSRKCAFIRQATPRDVARVVWFESGQQLISYRRAQSIGANQQICVDALAVRETKR
jgi:hypothetical protein